MKVLVILSLVALCYSTPITVHKRVTIGGDGTITIMGTRGGEIDIYRSVTDPTKLNIIIKSQFGVVRKIQVDNTADIKNVDFNTLDARFFKNLPREQITQANILVHIFREYEGLVDEPTYRILLSRIQTLVKEGFVHEAILEALRTLDQLRMVEDVKQVKAQDLMDNLVKEKFVKDVVYPVNEDSQFSRVGGIVPFGLNQYRNVLPVQGYHGVQGLWNVQNWTPYQREMLLQRMRQMQYRKDLGEFMPIEMLREQELMDRDVTRQQIMQQMYHHQLGQTEMSPLNRYLYNMGVLRGERFFYPQQLRVPQWQWETLENRYPQFVQREVFPQEFERFVEQGRFMPEETVYPQYGYGRLPMVY